MKILCGTDFSEQATTSCLVAAQIAKRLGDSLVLVHANQPWSAYPAGLEVAALEAQALELRAWAGEQMKMLAASIRERGVKVEEVVRDGLPDHVLADVAHQVDARLIVVGRHGRRGREPSFIGNTTERLVARADRPVLVINESTSGLQTWAAGERVLQLAAALDATESSDAVVAWIARLRATSPSDVTFIRCYWTPEELNRLGITGPFDSARSLEVTAHLEQQMREKVGALPGGGKVVLRAVPTWSRFGEALAGASEAAHADLLVVGTHQWHGLSRLTHWSVSRDLLREARLPVLCVPPSREAASPAIRPLPVYRRVLVPTDLSDLGNRAVPFAYGLVRELGGTVELVYVVESDFPGMRPAGSALPPLISAEQRLELDRKLRELVPKEATAAGLGTRVTIVEGGKAADLIVKLAERYEVDAICMSTHGKGLRKMVLGSVAQRVLESSERPVMLVRPPRQ
jgi:nucleotide-binding universal stress UspA family protein